MFLRVKQAAILLQVSPKKIRSWIVSGRIHAVNVGEAGGVSQWRIHVDELGKIKPPSEDKRRRRSLVGSDIDI